MSRETTVRIGLLGGTLNPIHYGHLAIAEQAREAYELDKVFFVPVGDPPHKPSRELAEKEHRYAMTLLAINENPHFFVSRIEIERKGLTFTVDTLRELKNSYPEAYRFYYIVGADTLIDLETWRNIDKVVEYTEFIAVYRPGIDKARLDKQVERFLQKYGKKVTLMEGPQLGISSTDIRQKVKGGKSIKYLLPSSVEKYILKNGLYR